MFAKFLNLNPEKQDRILNAALKEFAQKGYQNASTNEIVKEAEISKGLLFHYFKNKKDLYLFLHNHFLDIFMEEIHKKINWSEKDIFERYRDIARLKFEVYQKYPEMFNFIKNVFTEDAAEVKVDMDRRKQEILSKGYKDLFGDIDTSKFKEGIDVERAINIIFWTMEGFSNRYHNKLDALQLELINIDELIAEMEFYSEVLRQGFYK
ncbi:TetR/AcrR family transcriptional regulator [Paenibacillus wynnii]|uniref:TetR family transcriptional regulator n=1 Tax=Paenibacillus wynnii TaxID=268407 RepID=A0A098MBE1_9BACL|nr:TetR/AcrR family transcriptional regulator [Paenibacillus wynnii]KGE19368.1 TetR family transcriptional regulator [Paenibacillus wynnii]